MKVDKYNWEAIDRYNDNYIYFAFNLTLSNTWCDWHLQKYFKVQKILISSWEFCPSDNFLIALMGSVYLPYQQNPHLNSKSNFFAFLCPTFVHWPRLNQKWIKKALSWQVDLKITRKMKLVKAIQFSPILFSINTLFKLMKLGWLIGHLWPATN